MHALVYYQWIPPIFQTATPMADADADADVDNGSVASDETASTVDERDLRGGGGSGDDGTPSEEEEEDEPDGSGGGGGGGPAFRVREVACGDAILVVMDISLPPVGRPGGKARLGSFLFLRQCEELLYGSTAGSYTGALHMAVKVTIFFEGNYPYHQQPHRVDAARIHTRAPRHVEHGARVVPTRHGEKHRARGHGG